MKRTIDFLIVFLLSSSLSYADVSTPTEWTEEDGSPSVYDPYKIKVSNTTLTDNSDGTISINTSGSSSTPGGTNSNVQFNDSSSFGGETSFTWNKTSNTLQISRDASQTGYALVVSGDLTSQGVLGNISHDGTAFFEGIQLDNALPVTEGGTALRSGTSGGILGYTSTTGLASSALLTQYGVVIGGGSGATPSTVTADSTAGHSFFSTTTSPAFRQIVTGDVSGSWPPSYLNSGTGATTSTFWRGDGTWQSVTASPAGSDKQIQFNDASSAAGDLSLLWDKTPNTLSISRDASQLGNAINISSDNGVLLANISHDGSASFVNLQLNNALPVIEGGTGVSTSTGTTSVVLSTSPTITTPVINGTPDAAGEIGYNSTQAMQIAYGGITASASPIHGTIATGVGTQTFTNDVATDQDFTSMYTFPANSIYTNKVYRVTVFLEAVTGVSSVTVTHYLKIGGTKVYTQGTDNIGNSITTSYSYSFLIFGREAVGASANVSTAILYPNTATSMPRNITDQPVALATNGTLTINMGLAYSGTGSTETTEQQAFIIEELN